MAPYAPPDAHYCQVDLKDADRDLVMRIIGREGVHFKRITEMAKVEYIWWSKDRNVVEIWGPFNKMTNAKKMMSRHIEFHKNRREEMKKQKQIIV